MFRITRGYGFHLTFENGYVLSVQFGPGNYCEHHDKLLTTAISEKPKDGNWKSEDAEIAIFQPNGELIDLTDIELGDDQVKGHVKVDELYLIIQKIRELPIKSVDLV